MTNVLGQRETAIAKPSDYLDFEINQTSFLAHSTETMPKFPEAPHSPSHPTSCCPVLWFLINYVQNSS